jgi:hypothetical protein
LDSSGSGQGQAACCCEHGDDILGYIKVISWPAERLSTSQDCCVELVPPKWSEGNIWLFCSWRYATVLPAVHRNREVLAVSTVRKVYWETNLWNAHVSCLHLAAVLQDWSTSRAPFQMALPVLRNRKYIYIRHIKRVCACTALSLTALFPYFPYTRKHHFYELVKWYWVKVLQAQLSVHKRITHQAQQLWNETFVRVEAVPSVTVTPFSLMDVYRRFRKNMLPLFSE